MKDILNQKLSEQQTNDAMQKINKVIEKIVLIWEIVVCINRL